MILRSRDCSVHCHSRDLCKHVLASLMGFGDDQDTRIETWIVSRAPCDLLTSHLEEVR